MSETWYEWEYGLHVSPVTVVKETAKTVTVAHSSGERRKSKDRIFKTEVEARQAVVNDYRGKVEAMKDRLHRLRSELGQAEADLKKAEEQPE